MQGLADGYFVIPYTLPNYLAREKPGAVDVKSAEFDEAERAVEERTEKLLSTNGEKTVLQFHQELGHIMWNKVGMARNKQGLEEAMREVRELREQFWKQVKILGTGEQFNKDLEFAGRVADFLELGELLAKDALDREESCGGHFREEHQTEEGEAKRDDEHFSYVAAWEFKGEGAAPELHKEPLTFEECKPTQRSYK